MNLQSSEENFVDQLSIICEIARSSVEKTDEVVAFQSKMSSKTSLDTLKKYNKDITKMCQRKQEDLQKLKEHLGFVQKAFSDVETRMEDLMLMFQNNESSKQIEVTLLPSNEDNAIFPSVSPALQSKRLLFRTVNR